MRLKALWPIKGHKWPVGPLQVILGMGLLLAGCGTFGQTSPQALPTVVLENPGATPRATSATQGGRATASGKVVPVQEVHLAFSVPGQVKTMNVAVGDAVKAGQVLVSLEDSVLRAQIQQAQAEVAAAQANYDSLAAGPTDEQLRQAEDAVVVATANYSRTLEGPRPSTIAAAQAALAAASNAYNKLKAGPQPQDYAAAEANLNNAQAALQQAQWAYDTAFRRDPAGITASPAALALQQATNNYNAAKAAYDKAAQQPDAAQLSAAYQQVQQAQAALDTAMNPARDFDVVQARAQVDQAQAQLDALKAGPGSAQLDAARAQVDAAKAALGVFETQAQSYTLVAPFNGVVLSRTIEPGEAVLPGTPVLVLAGLDALRVETTDLSERDVPGIEIGQPATIFVKALNQNVTGKVSEISPLADTLGGDVVYKTTIDLNSRPAGLRVGMSVQVQFGTGQ